MSLAYRTGTQWLVNGGHYLIEGRLKVLRQVSCSIQSIKTRENPVYIRRAINACENKPLAFYVHL